MIDWNGLVAPKLVAPTSGQSHPGHEAWGYRPAVSMSSEMRRVLNLPRRALELDGTERAEAIVDQQMERFARPVVPGRRCRCAEIDPERHASEGCIERLRLVQAQALREVAICGGLCGPIGVGWGKTLIDLLCTLAFRHYDKNVNETVLVVPPGLAEQLENDYLYYGQHFKMPQIVFHGNVDYSNTVQKMDTRVPLERGAPTVHVVPYSKLSRPESTSWLERVLCPQAIIADECFPGATRVHTDVGELPIREVVEQNRGQYALSYDTENDRYVWRRITNRLRRDGNKPLVRVTHTRGSFVCTEDHKIWISDGRYVRAGSLTPEHSLVRAPLSEVPHAVLREEPRQVDSALLLQSMRRQRRVEGQEVAEALGREEAETFGCGGSFTGATRDLGGSVAREDVPRTRRERATDETATPSTGGTRSFRDRDGARDCDEGSTRTLPEFAGQLQGRHRHPGSEASDRSRRAVTPQQEVEVPRPPQDGDPKLSRVVGVEVLERGSADGYGSCRVGDPVYDLTVEGEHNYFADGILVSNCHKLRNIKTATGARVYRYMEEVAPQTKFVCLSGSMTAKKIQDYWHLMKWALRGGSPLPVVDEVVDAWGGALNPSDNPADPGPLMKLCAPGEHLYD
jgi:hypothetical protein